jgi:hypothetical protein
MFIKLHFLWIVGDAKPALINTQHIVGITPLTPTPVENDQRSKANCYVTLINGEDKHVLETMAEIEAMLT